jgi:hypothetical protein
MNEQKVEEVLRISLNEKYINAMISRFYNFEDAMNDEDWIKHVVGNDFFHKRLSLYGCYIECNNNKEKGLTLLKKRRKRFERVGH